MAANAAPDALETVRRFANSIDIETGEEELSSPAALAEWLRDHALCERAPRLKREDLERALELREALRAALLANAGGVELSPSAMTTLNRQLAAAPSGPSVHRLRQGQPGAGRAGTRGGLRPPRGDRH